MVCSIDGLQTNTCQGGARIFFTYKVKPTDVVPGGVQDTLTFTTPFRNVTAFGSTQIAGGTGVPVGISASAGIYIGAVCDAAAWDCASGNAPVGQATGANITFLPIVTNHITVVKNCPPPNCPPGSIGTGTPFGQPINFTGTVCNDGTVAVTITVTNYEAGAVPMVITNYHPTTHNGATFSGTLNPHDCIDFSGTEAALPPCGPVTNTVIASATDTTSGTPFTTYATNSAICPVCVSPCLLVTKTCPPCVTNDCVNGGVTYPVGGIVTNCGNVDLINVKIVDDNPDGSPITITIGSLPHFTAQPWSANNTVKSTTCGSITDHATATGNDVCTGTPITNTASCTTLIACPPGIAISKLVTCGPQSTTTGCNPPSCAAGSPCCTNYSLSATGVVGSAFCYQIIIHNTGCADLTNVVVSDSRITIKSADFPSRLNKGAYATNYYSLPEGTVGTFPNVATVTGNSTEPVCSPTGGPPIFPSVFATTNASVTTKPIELDCSIQLFSSLDVDCNNGAAVTNSSGVVTYNPIDNNITLVSNSTAVLIHMFVTLNNSGQADLAVTISGLPACVDCGTPVNSAACGVTATVPAGGSVTLTNCFYFDPTNCPLDNINVTATGNAQPTPSTGVQCVFNSCGQPISTNTSCTATIKCCTTCTPTTLCRVTGGGTLQTNGVDSNCQPITTTIFPNGVNGAWIDKITHGGQVGAPFTVMDCGAVIGNLCIRGEWEHNRHYAGGSASLADDVTTKFHNGTGQPNQMGYFDSLECACLGCCVNGVYHAPSPGVPVHRKVICNPDDRQCGPLPAPSPDNAIIFSGIGVFSHVGKNVKQTYAVWRVYIEDRGEPGGNKVVGAAKPSDIYCYQAWDTGVAVQTRSDPNNLGNSGQTSALGGEDINTFRADLGAADCAFLTGMQTGTIPIGSLPGNTVDGHAASINDCGPLYTGNHQLHPATGADVKCASSLGCATTSDCPVCP
ncbi:MAG: hypothetical protein C5B50_11375 [Verrucomicrobia bacterium]|nr:MAG: hypothetical protein C5B50_11375 [Verrucomicrobiota bacterium]